MSTEGPAEDAPEPASAAGRWAAALVPLVVGLAALANSVALGLGTLTAPGAGLWPAVASTVMAAGSVVLLITRLSFPQRLRPDGSAPGPGRARAWLRPNAVEGDGERFGPGTRTIGLALVVIGLYVLLFGGIGSWPGIGFEWATLAMLAFWLRFIGRESWRLSAIVAVAVTGTLHLIFIEVLKAPIPHVIGG